MDAVTYPSAMVTTFIEKNVVPLRLPYNHEPLAQVFNVQETPCLILLDGDGSEHHRASGFLSAEELIATIQLGKAKLLHDRGAFDDAVKHLNLLLAEQPKSGSAPEALYERGRCLYKSTHDPIHLKEVYEQLKANYPDSVWTTRAARYRLL